jgi:superfamily II RNA helicase
MRNELFKKNSLKIIIFIFRKKDKRVKIDENRRLKQMHDNDQEHQQLIKRDVSNYLIHTERKFFDVFFSPKLMMSYLGIYLHL